MLRLSWWAKCDQSIYNTFYRTYSASLCIWLSIDPKQSSFPSFTPYNFTLNNPLVLSDPFGDDPISGNRKEGRSIRKYGKHFAEEVKAQKEDNPMENDPNLIFKKAHDKMDDKHKNKKWMWVLEKDGLDGNNTDVYATSHNHAGYFSSGDLFVATNPQFNVQTTTTSQIATNLRAGSIGVFNSDDGLSSVGYNSYYIPSAGVVTFNFSSSSGTWTYNVRQGGNTPGPQSFSAVMGLTSLSGDVPVGPGPPVRFFQNVNPLNGNTLYATYVPPAGGLNSTGGLPVMNATITINVTSTVIRKPHTLQVISTKYNRNPHRLNQHTLNMLQTRYKERP